MQTPSNDKEYESGENSWTNPTIDSGLGNLKSMRVVRLSPMRIETGGIRRLNKTIDWETLVDALYAPKSRFSLN